MLCACQKETTSPTPIKEENSEFISAVDISRYPEILSTNPTFYDTSGNPKDMLGILKENRVNTIRLRLWVQPNTQHSGFEEVAQFSQTLKTRGFKLWLTLHYSDTWADPGKQETPKSWQGISFSQLKDSVYHYTQKVVTKIQPNYIQIGNEINNGFLHPHGHITSNPQQFTTLLQQGVSAVRANSKNTKIILHFAGIQHADWFFNQVKAIDYDIIGLSYYPIWHGKSLNALSTTMNNLSQTYNKNIVIAETAYPFTLTWNDWTTNIVGLDQQLILPEYPATADGQRAFIKKIRMLTQEVPKGIGFCYWGAELIAWKGTQATNASPWENQALFDFNNKALPVLTAFTKD